MKNIFIISLFGFFIFGVTLATINLLSYEDRIVELFIDHNLKVVTDKSCIKCIRFIKPHE